MAIASQGPHRKVRARTPSVYRQLEERVIPSLSRDRLDRASWWRSLDKLGMTRRGTRDAPLYDPVG